MSNWFMITLVGEDQPGIVPQVTRALYEAGCNLGETSMMRLGGNFTIMMMVQFAADISKLENVLEEVASRLRLRVHVDPIEGHLHHHLTPDVSISVFCADRAGIVAEATSMLAEAGLNILDLNSDVGGTREKAFYVMQIEGQARQGIKKLEEAVEKIREKGIDIRLDTIDTVVG